MDHLLRVQRLATECDEKEKKAMQAMDEPKEILETTIPEETGPAQRDLLLCKVCFNQKMLSFNALYDTPMLIGRDQYQCKTHVNNSFMFIRHLLKIWKA